MQNRPNLMMSECMSVSNLASPAALMRRGPIGRPMGLTRSAAAAEQRHARAFRAGKLSGIAQRRDFGGWRIPWGVATAKPLDASQIRPWMMLRNRPASAWQYFLLSGRAEGAIDLLGAREASALLASPTCRGGWRGNVAAPNLRWTTPQCSGCYAGMVTVARRPPSGLSPRMMSPPCERAMSRAIGKPSPVPLSSRLRALSSR